MKTVKLGLLLASFLFVSHFNLMGESGPKTDYEGYVANIRDIYKNIGDLTSELELKSDPQFSEISDHPLIYAEYALTALRDARLSQDEKLIVLLSAYKMEDVSRYCAFVNEVLQMSKNGKVSKMLLLRAAFPGDDWNRVIVNEYKNPSVVLLLEKIKQSDQLEKKDRILIDNILSGMFAGNR